MTCRYLIPLALVLCSGCLTVRERLLPSDRDVALAILTSADPGADTVVYLSGVDSTGAAGPRLPTWLRDRGIDGVPALRAPAYRFGRELDPLPWTRVTGIVTGTRDRGKGALQGFLIVGGVSAVLGAVLGAATFRPCGDFCPLGSTRRGAAVIGGTLLGFSGGIWGVFLGGMAGSVRVTVWRPGRL